MKKVLVVIVCVILALAMASCQPAQQNTTAPQGVGQDEIKVNSGATPEPTAAQSNGEGGKKTYTIGFSQSVMNHPFRIAMVNTFKSAAKNYADIVPIVVEGDGDVQKEITNIESLIQQGCDAIIISSLSGTAIYPAYKQIYDAGIPLVIAASGNAQEDEEAYKYYNSFVSTDEVEMGMGACDYANTLLNGKGNIVMIRGVVESTNSANRYEGWNKQIGNYPGLNVIVEQSAEWLRLTATEVMTNILQANANIDLVYCENDEMALGCLDAIKDAGRENEMKIISMDAQQDACEEILKGGAFVMTIENVANTAVAVEAAYQLAQGNPVDKRIILKYTIVDATNAADFLANNF